MISVVSGPNLSLDNISDFSDGENQSLDKADYNDTTIAGFKGSLRVSGGGSINSHPYPTDYDFFFMKDNKLVNVKLHGWSPYIEEHQIEDIIK